jgi:hypothetical protein
MMKFLRNLAFVNCSPTLQWLTLCAEEFLLLLHLLAATSKTCTRKGLEMMEMAPGFLEFFQWGFGCRSARTTRVIKYKQQLVQQFFIIRFHGEGLIKKSNNNNFSGRKEAAIGIKVIVERGIFTHSIRRRTKHERKVL